MSKDEIIGQMIDEEVLCNYCSLDDECPYGMACYGGEPIEPACAGGDYESLLNYESYCEDNNIEIDESEDK